jgi:nicotinamidase/pyrazinamidase
LKSTGFKPYSKRLEGTGKRDALAGVFCCDNSGPAAQFGTRAGNRKAGGMNDTITTGERDILLVVDVQNDFCPGGALAVPHGDEVIPLINDLAGKFAHVVLTQDWHPRGHLSFASSHPGKNPFETVEVSYGGQVLWPEHCVQGTRGAALHDDLVIPRAELIVRKGFHPQIDSYSAFYENDRKTPTGLSGYLGDRGFKRVFLAGLAFDFCVRYSAEDAMLEGFEAIVIEDACRAIDLSGSAAAAREVFARLGIYSVTTGDIEAAR